MAERAGEAVDAHHDEHVARPRALEQAREDGARAAGARGVLFVKLGAAGGAELLGLRRVSWSSVETRA